MPAETQSSPASGHPAKLYIVAYGDPQFKQEIGWYSAQINPEKYSQTYKIQYDTQAASGAPNAPAKFAHVEPTEMKFELIFDGTGAVDSTTNVDVEIQAFKDIVYRYDGKIHEPRYLGLFWGKLHFGARLTSLSISYTLFSPAGDALRARADASFIGYEDAVTSSRKANRQSADITHHVVTQAGDTLALLSHRIYGDIRFVREVARHNRLVNFRHLPAGTTLAFPPLA